jgi:integral membrane protein (TIGR00529 family)
MIAIIKLVGIFLIIVIAMRLTKQLSVAVALAAVAAACLYRLGVQNSIVMAGKAIISPMTINTVGAFYTITFLQRMLDKRRRLTMAQESLNGIFNNRRINATLAPVLIGMLPSAAVVTIAGAIVDESAGASLTVEEKTMVSTYYRHVSEAFLPTYASILIGAELAGVTIRAFLVSMIPVLVMIITAGWVLYIRKIPKDTGRPVSDNRLRETGKLLGNLWTILAIVVVVIAVPFPGKMKMFTVPITVTAIAIVNLILDKFTFAELKPMFKSAFEPKLIVATVMIMIFKDYIIASGVILTLPEILSQLPIPTFAIYMIIIFAGSIVAGQQAINVVALPMAFAAGTGEGAPLFMLLMTVGYCAMQISPVHICLPIIVEYFKTSMGACVRKTIPAISMVTAFATAYYLVLRMFI